jgi:hypothetical protein
MKIQFKFPNLEVMKHFKSISLDLNSLEIIKQRNWHTHIPLGVLAYIATYIVVSLIPGSISSFPKHVITTFLVFVGCMTFEWMQKGERFIGEPERFESNKDAIVSTPTFLLIILVLKLTRVIK